MAKKTGMMGAGLGAFAGLVCAAWAGAAIAETKPAAKPAQLEALMRCQGEADGAKRLACYDSAVAAMQTAVASGDLRVQDKAEVQRLRLWNFGKSSLPVEQLAKEDEIDTLALKIVAVTPAGDSQWRFELENGQVWQHTEASTHFRAPKVGSTLTIKKAALGSYLVKVDDSRVARAKRIR